jgi:hypothetical protein
MWRLSPGRSIQDPLGQAWFVLKRTMAHKIALQTGDVFAQRCVIERVLSEGDRKKTFLAQDRKMGREVALSFVKPEAALVDPEGTEREAKVPGRIGIHDNVVSLFDYEIAPDGYAEYMVFEYLRGGTRCGRSCSTRSPTPRQLPESPWLAGSSGRHAACTGSILRSH